MRIGIIQSKTGTGESNYGNNLIRGLKRSGIEIELIQNPLYNNPNIKSYFGSLFLKNAIKNKNISIIHNIDNLGPFLFNNEKTVKKILTVHDIAPIIISNINSWKIKFDFKFLLPKMIDNSDFIISVSYSTKKDLINKLGVNNAKIGVIPLGVNTSFFYPRSNKGEVLQKYGIKNKYLLYVGTDNPRKNLKTLIKAYGKIFNDIPHDLLLVGPIKRKNIESIVKKYFKNEISIKELLNRIKTIGYVDNNDLPAIYTGATAFIFPSLYEGFGLPPLEAMACGTPVIVSNNSSLNEVVGDSGLYINNPLNVDEISKTIIQVLENDNLKQKLKNSGFKQVKKFTWEKTIKETIKTYENLLEN